MTLTLGQVLRNTREERGLSLDEAARVTRIRSEYLQALEDDEPGIIPSRVQGRGFLRLYADYLQLPVRPLLDAWDGNPVEFPEEKPEETILPTLLDDNKVSEEEIIEISPDIPDVNGNIVEQNFPDHESTTETAAVNLTESSEIFKNIGETLRSTRDILGISINDVERFTRLRAYYISSLEAGTFDELPSPVQGRGMLSNYATFLNLDVDAILLQFADGLQKRRLEKLQPADGNDSPGEGTRPSPKPKIQSPWRRFITPDLLIGATLITALLIFIIWGAARVGRLNDQSEQPTTAPISEILVADDPAASLTGTFSTSQSSPIATDIGLTPQPEISSQETITSEIIPPASNAPLQVHIVANQRAWMRVTVDKAVQFEGRVLPGNAYAFSGRTEIKLETGNGAALQVIFNQTDLGIIGTIGEIVLLNFTIDGVTLPTPIFTPTATVTPLPTATSRPTATIVTPTITPYIP